MAAHFRVVLGGQGASAANLSLTIDNVDGAINRAINALREPVPITLERVWAHDPDTVRTRFDGLELIGATLNLASATGSIGRPLTSGPSCGITVNPAEFPAAFI